MQNDQALHSADAGFASNARSKAKLYRTARVRQRERQSDAGGSVRRTSELGAATVARAVAATSTPPELAIFSSSPAKRAEGRNDEAVETPPALPLRTRAAVSDKSALDLYLHQIRQYSVLTREQEHDLAVRRSSGAEAAISAQLVRANLRLVVKIAREYRRVHNSLLDLIQEGNVGLIHAVRRYDPHRGVRLCSYASWWIRAYILKFILGNWRLIKIGTTQTQRRIFFNLHKVRRKLDVEGAEVGTKQLADALYVSEKEVIEMERRLTASEISLDGTPRPDDQSGRARGPVLPASNSSRPDVQIEASDFSLRLKEKLKTFGATLRDRDLAIFETRLINDEPLTLGELAERFGVTRERARQIEFRLKAKLRSYLLAELGEGIRP